MAKPNQKQKFTVVATYTVYANDHLEAAQKAFLIADEKSPHQFVVTAANGDQKNIILSYEERDLASSRHADSRMFDQD